MPFYRDSSVGTQNYSLQDFSPTFGQSFNANLDQTVEGLYTPLAYDFAKNLLNNSNGKNKLTAYDAQNIIKESGVRGLNAEDGQYTQEALEILIERKRKSEIRNDVLSRTEYSLSGTPVRAATTLAASLLDPIGLAAMFIPVVGEARMASILAKTGAGSFARAGSRAGIGAIEGAVGMAALEPFSYYAHSQLQDDYQMSDSLLNVAFGGALGSVAHVTSGHIADIFRSSDPYLRFSGLSKNEVQTILDFEKIRGKEPAAKLDEETSTWTREMRRAAGIERDADIVSTANSQNTNVLSKKDFEELQKQYPKEIFDSISDRTAKLEEAPFPKITDITPERARVLALNELQENLHINLMGESGNIPEPKVIGALKNERELIANKLNNVDSLFKETAKQFQGQGFSRKQSESNARKQIEDLKKDLSGQIDAIDKELTTYRSASQEIEDISNLKKGVIPPQIQKQIEERAKQILANADMARAIQQVSARNIVEAATPEARQAAFRTALSQALNGRMPDVDFMFKGKPTAEQIKMVSDRQAGVDALIVGDANASNAASELVKEKSKPALEMTSDKFWSERIAEGKEALDQSMKKFEDMKKNLEQSGYSPEKLDQFSKELAPFDRQIAKSDIQRDVARAAAICSMRN